MILTITQIAELADENFVVVWDSNRQDGARLGAYGQVLGPEGEMIRDEFLINTYTTKDQWKPVVAPICRGGFVALWSSWEQDGSEYDIYGQRYNKRGQPADGGEFQVNTKTKKSQWQPALIAQSGDSEDLFALWTSQGQDGSGTGIQGRPLKYWPD